MAQTLGCHSLPRGLGRLPLIEPASFRVEGIEDREGEMLSQKHGRLSVSLLYGVIILIPVILDL